MNPCAQQEKKNPALEWLAGRAGCVTNWSKV